MSGTRLRRALVVAGWVGLTVALVAIPALLDRSDVRAAGDAYRYEWPWALLGLLVPAALLWLGLRPTRHVARWRYPLAPLAATAPRSFRTRLRHLPVPLRAAALGLLVVALARPQGTRAQFSTTTEGIDIIVALDMSGSMEEPDMVPNRFAVEKDVVRSFIRKRPNDRIGLVVFGSEAYPLSPMTADHRMLDRMLDDLRLEHMPRTMQNTAVGDALVGALARLESSDAESRVVILLTDGMDNESDTDPIDAAAAAARRGVKVYTVLMGVQGTVLPQQGVDLLGNPIFGGRPQQFPVDPELLRRIADKTGGAFFEAALRDDLERAFHGILNELKRTERVSQIELADERFVRFVWLAALLLGLEFLLRHAWLRELA